MVFTHDTAASLQAAVALVNSAAEPDTLTTVEALAEFYAEHEYSGGHHRDEVELEAVRSVRAALRELLTADRDTAVGLVNAILAEAQAVPRLVRHDRLDWHVHAIDDAAPLAERVLVETAMAMIDVIRADELNRLAICAADECDGLVFDLSRNRSRRYCSTACGNREAVAAYRARQRG
ncbi:MAG: protein of unknown function DUF1470 [uncultured Nocardioides sp.]|uniref:Zinc finger CGNR domain-containing protein n=1 Tax=uncultured Nocardioides sp. TaxID=198441 RepID=A0A6J4NZC1_9ACTN|nr:MAG: protein of unknown function DUF1470 [uncultured Nocardioides sp.]